MPTLLSVTFIGEVHKHEGRPDYQRKSSDQFQSL